MNQLQIVWRVERNPINGMTFRDLLVFSDKRRAINYGRMMDGDTAMMYEIDARNLRMTYVPPNKYQIVDEIPQDRIRVPTSVEDEYNRMIALRYERIPDRRYQPGREYNHEAGGYYSDEDDARDDIDMSHFVEYAMNH